MDTVWAAEVLNWTTVKDWSMTVPRIKSTLGKTTEEADSAQRIPTIKTFWTVSC